MKWIDVMEYE